MRRTICKHKCINKNYQIDYDEDLRKSNYLYRYDARNGQQENEVVMSNS